MHERACLEKVGLFDETLYAHEDWDLWIRLALHYPFLHIKQATAEFSWRTDGSSMTSSARETFLRTTEIIYRKYRPYTERVAGILDAQQRELVHRRQALESSAADAQTGERMYQCHRRFRTLTYFQRISFEQESPHVVDGYVLSGWNVLLAILSVGSLDGQMETSAPRICKRTFKTQR